MLTVYSASAGSGKTYNLVLDYLATCFRPYLPDFLKLGNRRDFEAPACDRYQNILAITFTNNAAAEMKERVVRQLNTFSFATCADDLNPNDFENLCKKVFGDRPDLTRDERFIFVNRMSKALLNSILYDYARFSITTIDSFIQRVIRSSALYLDLSMNYAVQIRLTDFFQMAIEQYICELSNNNLQFKVVVKELMRQLEDRGAANINRFLSKALGILYYDAEKSHPHVKKFPEVTELLAIVEQWKNNRRLLLQQCVKELEPVVRQALQIFQEAENENIMPNGTQKWDLWFRHVLEDPFEEKKGFENSRCLKEEIKTETIFKVNGTAAEKTRKDASKMAYAEQIKGLFLQVQDIVLKKQKKYFSYHILAKNANHLLVIDALRTHIENIKKQTDSFFLSESNPLLNDQILSETNGAPLFEKMSFYQLFFIDEFQDTSLMQWQDLKPLIINALGTGGNLTLFGDVKQSIYRFRNGEAELFYRLSNLNRLQTADSEKDISSMVGTKDGFHYEPLSTNYRSREAVVEFNNRFFGHYASDAGKGDYYADVAQSVSTGKTGGLVQVLDYEDKDLDYRDIRTVWPECDDTFYNDTYLHLRHEEAELLYAVMDARQRGYRYGDMAVLLSGRAKCNEFAQTLMLADIPVITSESLQLCDNPNIDLIISTLRYTLNTNDTLAQTVILNYLSQKSQSDFSDVLCEAANGKFPSVLSERFGIRDFQKSLDQWRKDPFLIAVKNVVRFYGFDRDADPFVADFLDQAADFAQTHVASIADFLVWWDDINHYSETIPRLSLSGEADAVRLMTIHASKGLEFPVVITYCTQGNNSRDTFYWVTDPESGQSCYVRHEKNMQFSDFKAAFDEEEEKQTLDKLNLWYVDFTRARDMLTILNGQTEKERTDKKLNVKMALGKFIGRKYEEKPDTRHTYEVADTEGGIHYYGDIAWTNPEEEKEEAPQASTFRVTCSDMAFCGNRSLSVIQRETETMSMETGNRIHAFLQKLTLFPSTSEERYKLTEREPEDIRERLIQLFERTWRDPNWRPYFYVDTADRVLNEVPILLPDGGTRRPDRIVIKPDHVMVIDYKTGREHGAKYEAQLAEYRECLLQMGYEDVRTSILYIG